MENHRKEVTANEKTEKTRRSGFGPYFGAWNEFNGGGRTE
jgi:hypothetical protein